jgi:hypothetical protein
MTSLVAIANRMSRFSHQFNSRIGEVNEGHHSKFSEHAIDPALPFVPYPSTRKFSMVVDHGDLSDGARRTAIDSDNLSRADTLHQGSHSLEDARTPEGPIHEGVSSDPKTYSQEIDKWEGRANDGKY